MAILRARRENMHVNIHCRVCATLKFCYKIAQVPSDCLPNPPIFLCKQDLRAHTTGCKRGFREALVFLTRTYVHVQWDVREALVTSTGHHAV